MSQKQTQAWWKYGYLWLVIAGPAVVVVASFITLYLAITIPDPVVSSTVAPATQARNHAATGAAAVPKK